MSIALRRTARRRDARALAAVLISAIALSVGLAHSGMANDHMGEAAAICLAVGVAAVAIATLPQLGRHVPGPRRPQRQIAPAVIRSAVVAAPITRSRGHPSLLQVIRR